MSNQDKHTNRAESAADIAEEQQGRWGDVMNEHRNVRMIVRHWWSYQFAGKPKYRCKLTLDDTTVTAEAETPRAAWDGACLAARTAGRRVTGEYPFSDGDFRQLRAFRTVSAATVGFVLTSASGLLLSSRWKD